MEAGKYRAFQGRLNSRSEPRAKLVAKTPNPQVLARVSLLASHERLREKRLCLAGVQAIKSRFFAPIYRKYLYILSYPVFLYYAESPKVPPRVFGPLGPKTQRGQKSQNPIGLHVYTNTLLHEGYKSNLEFMTKIFGKNIQALNLYTLIHFFFNLFTFTNFQWDL